MGLFGSKNNTELEAINNFVESATDQMEARDNMLSDSFALLSNEEILAKIFQLLLIL